MKKLIFALIIVLVLLVGTIGVLAAYAFNLIDFGGGSSSKSAGKSTLKNPTEGLTDEEAALKFDESFVYYILVSIGAGKLHNPPFSSDTPKIEFYIGEEVFSAEIIDGSINVAKGEINGNDIKIRTSRFEAVKMTRNRNYISESFSEGNSEVELIASKTRLASKGYLSLMDQFG